MLFKKGNLVVKRIGGNQRILSVIQLGKSDLGVNVNKGLPIDEAYPFNITNIVGILYSQISTMVCLISPCAFFQRSQYSM